MTMNKSTPNGSTQHPEWDAAVRALAGEQHYLLLETNLPSDIEQNSYLFLDPVEQIQVFEPDGVDAAFDRIEAAVQDGLYAAGFFSYELGYCLEPDVFDPPGEYPLPLLSVGLYHKPYVYDVNSGEWIGDRPDPLLNSDTADAPDFAIKDPVLSETWPVYERNIREVKRRIELGETYQINYTLRLFYNFEGDPLGLYLHLRDQQRVAYSGIWRNGQDGVLTLSPELFFRISNHDIEVRPMKGTVKRGKDRDQDNELKDFLHNDTKNRAENLMIVDLLRNDLGRVSETGSVHVPRLFEVEPYETLFQMTSTVRARLEKDVSIRRLFTGIFPSGSVTGAPKIRSMQIIRELEGYPRGVYTGAVGFVGPRREKAVFNVAIRTLAMHENKGEMGIGGGIVYDSQPDSEWREALLKARFLTGALDTAGPSDFQLIETMLWSPQKGYAFAQLHLERLMFSADHFNFNCDINMVAQKLTAFAGELPEDTPPQRVRMLLFRDGRVTLEKQDIGAEFELSAPWCTISDLSVLSSNPFLRHKTTVRDFYNGEYMKYSMLGHIDVLFLNERGELTEGCITNVMVKIGDKIFTPPLNCGLLDGVYRRHLLQTGQVKERVIRLEDLAIASGIYLCNSVRGLFPVELKMPAFLKGRYGSGSCSGCH